MIKIFHRVVSLMLVISLIIPLLADARAGSRVGGGTYRSGPSSGFGGGYRRPYQGGSDYTRPRSSYGTPYNQGSAAVNQYRGSSGSFFSGLASGLLGAWLYSKFTGNTTDPNVASAQNVHNQTADQKKPAPAEGGGFLRMLLFFAIIFFLWRFIRNRRKGGQDRNQSTFNNPRASDTERKMSLKDFVNLSRPAPERNVSTLSQDDHNEFERALIQIQNAWAQSNFSELQRLTTPDIYNNFVQIIRENQQQNITTHVSQVKLLNQELLDTWQEGNSTFARVALTWSALDYAINNSVSSDSPGYIVDGNRNEPTTVTEIWTFARSNNRWLLADIQQA